MSTPAPVGGWKGAVARLDTSVDEALEPLRGRPVPDTIFSAATHAGEFAAVWHLVNIGWWVVDRDTAQAVRFAVLIVLESIFVNQVVKRLVRRQRPTTTGDPRVTVRKPLTSSFPSGHASSGFFAATLLTARQPVLGPIWFLLAALIATSRVYVRLHHASDVIAGAILGVALALFAGWVWPA